MHKHHSLPILFSAALLFSAHMATSQAKTASTAQSAVLTIQADQSLAKVSPTLYGLMTEEINHAYDGGLYAELIRNRAMQHDPSSVPGWAQLPEWPLVLNGSARATASLDPKDGPSTALTRSLKLTVQQADAANPAGVRNDGFWGIPVRPNITYTGSLYAKASAGAAGPLTLRIVNNNTGATVASTQIPALSTAWKQYHFTLQTGAIAASTENHFELTTTHTGSYWFDLVSLFPPTYHNTPNGNRIDLMEKLAAMHPAFLRLPGGNYLEGNTIAQRFRWRQTLGPLVDRPTHMSPWGYRSSDGLGLLEYLEWCEDLHMQPVLAVYAGYSLHGEHVTPGKDLQPYVQSALDEIEYVTGDAQTRWGAERVKDGHPAPFPLTYVEVGNEDEFDKSNSYDGRFTQFYDAIRKQYPHLQIIATAPVKSRTPDGIDEHYYRTTEEFFNDAHHYDQTSRKGPKIFVGEWATMEGSPTPDMGAALSDAAWMTGMERNSDLVIMSSYAPLLVNVNPKAMQWTPNLIGYDALHSYGSPSYYAQVLFSSYLGTEVTSASLQNAGSRLYESVTRDAARRILYVKIVNTASTPQPLQIHIAGVRSVEDHARLFVLRGHSMEETNTLTNPMHIAPVSSRIAGVAATFQRSIPPYSISVFEIHYH
jgi:alpha-N-arabinofuranosidase